MPRYRSRKYSMVGPYQKNKLLMAIQQRFALNLILDSQDRLLLLLRNDQTNLGPNKWGLPAGKIEGKETPPQAARRERIEEIGNEHEIKLIRYFGPVVDSFYGGKYEIHLFQFTWKSGQVTLNPEHKDFAWVTKEEIANMDVMLGIEENIAMLGIWPTHYLNESRLPKLKSGPSK